MANPPSYPMVPVVRRDKNGNVIERAFMALLPPLRTTLTIEGANGVTYQVNDEDGSITPLPSEPK